MRSIVLAACFFLPCLAQAEDWMSDNLGIRASLPDPPNWSTLAVLFSRFKGLISARGGIVERCFARLAGALFGG